MGQSMQVLLHSCGINAILKLLHTLIPLNVVRTYEQICTVQDPD